MCPSRTSPIAFARDVTEKDCCLERVARHALRWPLLVSYEDRPSIYRPKLTSHRDERQDGTFALNFLARAASVFSHWISRSVPVRNRSIHSGGSTEKSIEWRPQSGRRPSSAVEPDSRASSHEPRRQPA